LTGIKTICVKRWYSAAPVTRLLDVSEHRYHRDKVHDAKDNAFCAFDAFDAHSADGAGDEVRIAPGQYREW